MSIYRTALQRIAATNECFGPGCHYCESESDHPPSVGALIARDALRDESMRQARLLSTEERRINHQAENNGWAVFLVLGLIAVAVLISRSCS